MAKCSRCKQKSDHLTKRGGFKLCDKCYSDIKKKVELPKQAQSVIDGIKKKLGL